MAERILKKKQVRERLGVSKYQYKKLIQSGVLAAPILIIKNSHSVHTENQVLAAERKIRQMAEPPPPEPSVYRMSDKIFNRIANAYRG